MSLSAVEESQTDGAVDNAETISGLVRDHLKTAIASVGTWVSAFSEEALTRLGAAGNAARGRQARLHRRLSSHPADLAVDPRGHPDPRSPPRPRQCQILGPPPR